MYPQRELTVLAAYKAALRRKIALRRAQVAAAGAVVAQPFVWLDRMREYGRKLSPWIKFGAVPLGFLLWRKWFPRLKILGPMLRWSPVIFSAVRGLGFAFARSGTSPKDSAARRAR